jgi:hypothetical protein
MKGHDYTLYILCAKWSNNTKSKKKNESKLENNKYNILSF